MSGWDALALLPQNQRALHRLLINKPNAIAPEIPNKSSILSDNYDFLKMTTELAVELTDAAPASIDNEGFADRTAITENFYKLLTVSGMIMNPVSIIPKDNAALCENLNLVEGFISDRHAKIWTVLHDLQFGKIAEAPLNIKKAASTGFPHSTIDLSVKKELLFSFAEDFDDISVAFDRGNLRDLFFNKQIFLGSASGLRLQPDRISRNSDGTFSSKDRLVNDADYALSSGKDGKRFVADKSVYRKGNLIPNHFAMRARTVWGAPFAPNYYIAMYFSLFRAHYLEKYAFTWKHRTPLEIEDKLSSYTHVIGVDVAQFDQSIPAWILKYFCDMFANKLDERVINLIRMLMKMPYFQANPIVDSKDKNGGIFMGDPFDISTFDMKVGLPSGISPNPDIGKYVCTATYLCLFDDHFHDVLEVGVGTILSGKNPLYGLLNAGDDCVLMTNDSNFRDFFTTWQKSNLPYYLRIEPESGISFLGNVIYKKENGRVKTAPNVTSFITNWLVPEHSITSRSRVAYHFRGWEDRKSHFSAAPMYDVVFEIWERKFHKYFKESLNLRENYYREHSKMPLLAGLTDIDKQVMLDPDKLNYKFSNADVSAVILDLIVAAIPFDVYYPYIKHFIKL